MDDSEGSDARRKQDNNAADDELLHGLYYSDSDYEHEGMSSIMDVWELVIQRAKTNSLHPRC